MFRTLITGWSSGLRWMEDRKQKIGIGKRKFFSPGKAAEKLPFLMQGAAQSGGRWETEAEGTLVFFYVKKKWEKMKKSS